MLRSKQHILRLPTIEGRLLLPDGLLRLVTRFDALACSLGDALDHFEGEFLIVDLDI